MLTNPIVAYGNPSGLLLNEPDNESISQIIAELLLLQKQGKLECILNHQLINSFGLISQECGHLAPTCGGCNQEPTNIPDMLPDQVVGDCLVMSPKFVIKNPYAIAYNKLF